MDNYKVYLHRNRINQKIYIGQTKKKISQRWGHSGGGYRYGNAHFWYSIQKYGWDNFDHIVLFDRLSKDEANEIEIELIAYLKTQDRRFGYNVQKGGDLGNVGVKHSKKTRKKLSRKNKGHKCPEHIKKFLSESRMGEGNPMYGKKASKITKARRVKTLSKRFPHGVNAKKVICLETKKIYPSIVVASKELNICRSHISSVCNGSRKSIGGLHFAHLDEYDENKIYDMTIGDNKPKKVICLETKEVFSSIHEAGEKLGIRYTYISDVVKGRYKTTKGLHFKYFKDYNEDNDKL